MYNYVLSHSLSVYINQKKIVCFRTINIKESSSLYFERSDGQNITTISSDSNSWQIDPIGNWCCGYIGCPDNSTNPDAGAGMYTGPDGQWNAKNFRGKPNSSNPISGYDSNTTFLSCDSTSNNEFILFNKKRLNFVNIHNMAIYHINNL